MVNRKENIPNIVMSIKVKWLVEKISAHLNRLRRCRSSSKTKGNDKKNRRTKHFRSQWKKQQQQQHWIHLSFLYYSLSLSLFTMTSKQNGLNYLHLFRCNSIFFSTLCIVVHCTKLSIFWWNFSFYEQTMRPKNVERFQIVLTVSVP